MTKEQAREDEPTPPDGAPMQWNVIIVWVVAVLIGVVAVVLAITLSGREEEEEEAVPVSYGEGVSLVTYYAVETLVRSRLARTTVTIQVANGLDCSSIHSITLQLPRSARVTSLETITEDCTIRGEIQTLEDARETFFGNGGQRAPRRLH
jgi:hypothetical protein